MDVETISQELNERFAAPLPEYYNRRIIVWYDDDGEFSDQIDEMHIPSTIAMRDQMKRYDKFLKAKSRREDVVKVSDGLDTPMKLQLAILASITGASKSAPLSIIRSVLEAGLEKESNQIYQEVEKYEADDLFWSMVSQIIGYTYVDRNLSALAAHILLTAGSRTLPESTFEGLSPFISTGNTHVAYCADMVAEWIHSDASSYEQIAEYVEDYNMGRHTMGLVGLWDVVAFDEVAGIKFKDNDGIQIMKDYMASGSFARDKEEKAASASMVFVGNINQSVDVLLKTSSLFDPFPPEMGTDTAFLDRIHCYNPGWEIPKFRPQHFTSDYGFITDYLAGWIREMRKEQYGDAIDKYFRLGNNLNQRDTIAVRKMVDGYIKLIYPDGNFTKEDVEEILTISLEMRRRVKEQLKKLGGMEFYDVNFSYIDMNDMSEHYVSVPEQGGGKLIPEGICNPGQVYTVSHGGDSDMIGVFRLESQMTPGNGKFDRTGLGTDRNCKESVDTAYNYLKANSNRISGKISTSGQDYIINYQDLHGIGMTHVLALPTLIALCSIALSKPVQSSMVVLGDFSIGGTLMKVENLASTLQVCLDSGAKKVLLPQVSAVDLATVPAELMSSFSLVFYQSAEDAVFKALGVE